MKPRLVIVGAGGHARVLVSIIRQIGKWDVVGVLDRTSSTEAELIDRIPVIGDFGKAEGLYADGIRHAALAIGDNAERGAIHKRLRALGFSFPSLCHPSAIIEDNVDLKDGSVVCAGAILCAQVRLGTGVIVNTGAILDHEVEAGDYAHIAPGCRVAGRVRIGEGVMLGIGSSVREKITIGARTIVGAGSVVVDDIPSDVVAFGVPARVVRPRTQ